MAMHEGRYEVGADPWAWVAAARRPQLPAPRAASRRSLPAAAGGMDTARTAQALGWFSLGLGLAQVLAPRDVARLVGAGDGDTSRDAMLACGVREIATGIGILARPGEPGWLWARAAGDVMDMALLGAASRSPQANPGRIAGAMAAVAGVAALDVLCGQQLGRQRHDGAADHRAEERAAAPRLRSSAIRETKVITIGHPAEELYRTWRDFENLPRFMKHLESVTVRADGRSHWVAKAPLGRTVEWDAEVTEDRPNERISWRSVEGADVDNAGSVSFTPAAGGRGTVVKVELAYDPPGGIVGATIAKLFGEEPGQQLQEDLRAFKQLMETGEVVRSDASTGRLRHPARPSADAR